MRRKKKARSSNSRPVPSARQCQHCQRTKPGSCEHYACFASLCRAGAPTALSVGLRLGRPRRIPRDRKGAEKGDLDAPMRGADLLNMAVPSLANNPFFSLPFFSFLPGFRGDTKTTDAPTLTNRLVGRLSRRCRQERQEPGALGGAVSWWTVEFHAGSLSLQCKGDQKVRSPHQLSPCREKRALGGWRRSDLGFFSWLLHIREPVGQQTACSSGTQVTRISRKIDGDFRMKVIVITFVTHVEPLPSRRV